MPQFPRSPVWAAVPCALLLLLASGCGSGGNDDGGGGNQPTSITVASGNFASARYGTVVTPAPTVLVASASGPLAGATVSFTVQSGAGSLASTTAVTNASGVATLPQWTLGPAPGTNVVRAAAGSAAADITALATSGPPSDAVVEAGDNQTGVEKASTPVRPAVRVTDGTFGVPGVQVTFAITSGNGIVSIPVVTTNSSGIATVGGWRLGDIGTNVLTATVAGLPTPVTFTANAVQLVVSGINRIAGDAQTGFNNNYASARPVVEVLNQFSQPAEGVPVTFTATGGGGTVFKFIDTTRANGRAGPGAWRFGTGAQSLQATAAGASTTFSATAAAAPATQFNIEVRYLGTPPAANIQAAFTAAATRWSQVIVGDLPNNTANLPLVQVNFGGSVGVTTCSPALSGAQAQVDDIVIFADIRDIDGVGQILGGATPAVSRTADQTTITGCMIFDLADLGDLQSEGLLDAVIIHEMGHVIGIGANWEGKGLLVGACPTGSLRPYFTGASSRQAFVGSLTTAFTDSIVPVEGSVGGLGVTASPCPADGTRDSHWSESALGNELMTGYVDPGSNPLSAITAASVRDLGYVVNDAASDGFSLLQAPALRVPGRRVKLHEVDFTGRRYQVDPQGNVTSNW